MISLLADYGPRAIEELSEAVQTRNDVLSQLLPSIDFNNFPGLSKEKIENLCNFEHPESSSQPRANDATLPLSVSNPETLSESEHEWNESREHDYTSPIGDDVDGLASQDKHGSYLGISSISAALRLIFFASPTAKQKFVELSRTFPRRGHNSIISGHTTRGSHVEMLLPGNLSTPLVPEQLAIDAYFEHLHGTNAMLDEELFRRSFQEQVRTDDAWIALFNTVAALGSIASGDEHSHVFYYSRAQAAIGYRTFGTGNLEMLQALILLGGGYLHYINSPNTSYLIMGVAFRMAIAMALHREPSRGPVQRHDEVEEPSPSTPGVRRLPKAEIRRRTWWTLVYTDTTSSLALGRPPTIRWDPATMDTALPSDYALSESLDTTTITNRDGINTIDYTGTALRVCGEFAKICSRVEYRMAQFSRMAAREILTFETQIQAWEKNCPQIFQPGNPCPKGVRFCRDLLHFRQQVVRIVLSRPHILRLIEDNAASTTFEPDDWRVVAMCQEAGTSMINIASANPGRSRIAVWHCSWHLFQACMIPLLSLILASRGQLAPYVNEETVTAWMESLERAIRTFRDMEPYKRSTDRYGSVIEALYNGVIADRSMSNQPTSSLDGIMSSGISTTIFDSHDLPPMEAFQDWFNADLMFGAGDINWHLFPEEYMLSFPQGG
ncbi:hypothetical protein LTR84_000713 [Exophiala bonariae]|uniref:Xylanolytic transcriptional activator regulatory domain-containing protein n=1 Tax=Exophiala bonariae TaxID=1690606 RepID=A0AAV9NT43_9EURO|nr:hypothetical protein LTR84_000713 [Exophiala bonariae]